MLKQVFDKDQLSKVLSSSDVWQWGLLSSYGDVETAVDHTVQYWKSHNLTLSSLEARAVKSKPVFIPANMEDAFAIKLLDRFIRRIYKVRQSDRNRIVRQLVTLLKDSGKYHVLRLDIKDCYETIQFEYLINKFKDELILAPECIKLLSSIHSDPWTNHGMHGLPRGLSISPTLAELYLERLDKKVASHPNVIYSARYVDDIIILTPAGKENSVQTDVEAFMNEMNLNLNNNTNKYYSGSSCSAEFDYLGYSIKVEPIKNNPNKVTLKISQSKLNKLKSRIAISFCDHKKQNNIPLLKRRLEYICMLKSVRKGKNGDLLAGLAHNYQYVTDDFECLKSLDGFLCQQLVNPRFGLSQQEQNKINKISIYGNARKRNVGKFSKKQTAQIMRVWKNA
ncbi:antiviral reverse transcriptase Drt3a [Oceanospirillum beijerinckii]|uniref:antiviral reverse transcriptase Drt3a n=1 Tax=Oceanospirillum beijerinckii TaxID=64976 RepID=UPI000408A157|nr:antiviral reverse transcriptase Drt3a [Oceanospirillum beijerinckii]